MLNYLNNLRGRKGFTLVELMIVVAIIGVLASVAVPQYSKFQAKSRQSEVRIQLGAAYTVEQSFAAENSTYTSCLGSVGYNRDGTKFYYTIGFSDTSADDTACQPGNTSAGACNTYQWQYGTSAYTAASSCAISSGITSFPANISEPGTSVPTQAALAGSAGFSTAVTGTSFIIGGVGNVLKSASRIDGWRIDQNKQVLNSQSGLQ